MKATVKKGFVDGRHGSFSEGDVIEVPKGADWVAAGLVEPIKEKAKKKADK